MGTTMMLLSPHLLTRRTRGLLQKALWSAACLLALFACLAHAGPIEVDADFIWNDADAREKCPRVCSTKSLYWTGTWRKTGWAETPVCSCDDKPPKPPRERPQFVPVTPAPVPGVVIQTAPTRTPDGSIVRYDYTDFPDNDLRNARSPSFDDCAGMCMEASDCRAFTFAADQRRCYLKSDAIATRQTATAASGVVSARGAALPGAVPATPAQGTACSIGSTQKCPGCSVTCAPGQSAVCEQAVEGVTSTCARNASCRCS